MSYYIGLIYQDDETEQSKLISSRSQRWQLAVVVTLAMTITTSAWPNVIYDAALGTTPASQGWLALGGNPQVIESVMTGQYHVERL